MIDQQVLTDLGRMLWLPYSHPRGEEQPRSAEVITYDGVLRSAEEWAALAPADATAAKRVQPHGPPAADPGPSAEAAESSKSTGPMAQLFEALAASPSARDYRERGVAILCPIHQDSAPSAIVYFVTGKLHCSACGRSWELREWIGSPGGRALVGGALADRILAGARDSMARRAGPRPLPVPETVATAKTVATSPRPEIILGADEAEIADQAEQALGTDPAVYQRAGLLVTVRRDLASERFLRRAPGAPHIAELSHPECREACSRSAVYLRQPLDAAKPPERVRPPDWVVSDLRARGQWASIRPLAGVIESPILRGDGTVLATPGYDGTTGLILEPTGTIHPIPEVPSRQDALAARDALLDVVVDFPFGSEAHRSAWLASVLVFFARQAISGRVPMTLFEAPAAGTGKTLLADTIGMICLGRELAKMANTTDDAEMRKRLLAIALAGDSLVLLDNVRGGFGTPSLDMALTAGVIRDRILGLSEERTVPLDSIFMASGNNVELLGDTRRRVLHCRIDSGEERPEERQGFRHSPLLPWIQAERPRLVAAALTILRAFHVAGRPQIGKVRPWGSFEEWQALVCGAIRWLDLAAPEDTREGLVEGESESERLGALLRAWREAQPAIGMTATEALALSLAHPALRPALDAACPPRGGGAATAESVGYGLRRFRERVLGGLRFVRAGERGGAKLWLVRGDGGDRGDPAAHPRAQDGVDPQAAEAGTSPPSPSSPLGEGVVDVRAIAERVAPRNRGVQS